MQAGEAMLWTSVRSLSSWLKTRSSSKGALWGVAVLTAGATSGRLVVFLASPIVARLYDPGDFGVVAVYVSMLALTGGLATLGYSWALPMARDDEDTKALLYLTLSIVVATGFLTGLVTIPFADPIASAVNSPDLSSYMWLLALGTVGIGTYRTLEFLAVREERFGLIAKTKVNQALAQVATQVGLGFARLAPAGLLVGYILGQSSGIGTLGRAARGLVKRAGQLSEGSIGRVARRFRRYPLFTMPSTLVGQAVVFLPAVLFSALFGPVVAGSYFLAARTIEAPLTLIGRSVGTVYHSRAAGLVRNKGAGMPHLLVRYAGGLLVVGLLPALALFAFGPYLFEIVFGSKWRLAGIFARIRAFEMLAQFATSPVSTTATVLDRQHFQLLMEAPRLIAVVGVFSLAHLSNLSARTTLVLYSTVMALGYVSFGLFHWGVARRAEAGRLTA